MVQGQNLHRETKYRFELDGLRAVAVLLVVLYHAGVSAIPGGYVGVDIFFVLSGYLITSQLWANVLNTGGVAILGFYSRRTRRLVPTAALVILTTLLATWLLLPSTIWKNTAWDGMFSAFSLANYRFASQASDYFQLGVSPSAFLHFWSLCVEEQFYLIWPLVIAVVTFQWLKNKKPSTKVAKTILIGVLGSITLTSLALNIILSQSDQPLAFFGLSTRAWELGVGSLLALGATNFSALRQKLSPALAWVGLAGILVSAVCFTDQILYPSFSALLPALSAAAVVFASESSLFRFLRVAPMRAIGRWSYALYLWHWPILVISAGVSFDRELPLRVKLILMFLALVLSGLTYRFYENPIRRSTELGSSAFKSLAFSLALTLVASLGGFFLNSAAIAGQNSPVRFRNLTTVSQLQEAVKASVLPQKVPANLTPRPGDAKDLSSLTSYESGCMANINDHQFPECVFGDSTSEFSIWLVGDSHANHWFSAVEKVANRRHLKLVLHTRSGCPILDEPLKNPSVKTLDYEACTDWTKKVFEAVAKARPNLLIVGGTVGITGFHAESYGRSIQRLSRFAENTIVLGDSPRSGFDIPDCVARNPNDYSSCNLLIRQRGIKVKWGDLVEKVRKQSVGFRVTYQATSDWLCLNNECPAIIANVLMYRDMSHLTVAGSKLMSPFFDRLIGPFVEETKK